MKNLQYLGDVIGPRLTGSAAMRLANDWTAERFKSYGLTAALEPWDFGITWQRGVVIAQVRWVRDGRIGRPQQKRAGEPNPFQTRLGPRKPLTVT